MASLGRGSVKEPASGERGHDDSERMTVAMDRTSFQPGLSMAQLIGHFDSERQCEQAPISARWPDRFVYRRCPN
jgi:hypothetical protein